MRKREGGVEGEREKGGKVGGRGTEGEREGIRKGGIERRRQRESGEEREREERERGMMKEKRKRRKEESERERCFTVSLPSCKEHRVPPVHQRPLSSHLECASPKKVALDTNSL